MEYQKIIKLSKTSLQNNSETVTNDSVKYISLEKRQKKKIDNLRWTTIV